MDMSLEIDRLSEKDAESRPHFEIGELVKAYDNLQENFKTTPYMALLCHYSVLDPRFPLPQTQFKYLGSKLSALYQSLCLAQHELSHSPKIQSASCLTKIAKTCDMIRHLDVYDENAVAKMQKDVQDCLDEVEHWRLRFDLQATPKSSRTQA